MLGLCGSLLLLLLLLLLTYTSTRTLESTFAEGDGVGRVVVIFNVKPPVCPVGCPPDHYLYGHRTPSELLNPSDVMCCVSVWCVSVYVRQ